MTHHMRQLFLATTALGLICLQDTIAQDNPNIVLFLVDDMGWTDWQQDASLNPEGSVVYETPNMLQLAQSGKVFDNAYAASPVCSPTRAAIMTGKTPARTRISDFISGTNNSTANLQQPAWTKNLPSSEITLAESLSAAGYTTGFFGKWHLGQGGNNAADPLLNGFDVNVGGTASGNPGGAGGFFAGSDGRWAGLPGLDTFGTYPSDKYLSDALSEQAQTFITNESGEPFFLMMSHYLVHTPIQAPSNLITKYTNKINSLQGQGVDLKDHDNPTYAAMVEKMDQSLGNLLTRLDDPNGDGNTADSVRDNTLIVFASDNGGLWSSEGSPTRNLPLREGKGSMYEGGIRTPFLMSWTGNASVQQGVVTDARTSAHDIYATALDAAGVLGDGSTPQTTGAELDGVSVLPALEGQAFDRGLQHWHYPHISPQDRNSGLISGGTFVSAVRKDEWKLVFFYDDRHYELYNLESDLGETTDVLSANREVAFELSAAMSNYLVDVNAQMPISQSTNQPVDVPPILFAGLPGDFDNSGMIDSQDWIALRSNLFSDVSSLTEAEAYLLGDINIDGQINRTDFAGFQQAFEAANGAGSFAQLLATIPEPTSSVMLAMGVLAFQHFTARQRTATSDTATLANHTSAQALYSSTQEQNCTK